MSDMTEPWNEEVVFKRKFTFRFGDCTPRKEASVFTVLKVLSEIAGEHYENIGLGHEGLLEQGIVFLLSRVSLRINALPRYAQSVVVSTWERDVKGPLFYRDYEVKGEDGELLISASSAWLIANPVTREILRPAAVNNMAHRNPRKAACDEPKKLRRNPELAQLGERPIYYSDLDGNGHVNNAVYGAISMDFLPEPLREKSLRDFHISFNMEVHPGETLTVFGGESRDGYELQGRTGDDLHFAALFVFDE